MDCIHSNQDSLLAVFSGTVDWVGRLLAGMVVYSAVDGIDAEPLGPILGEQWKRAAQARSKGFQQLCV